VYSHAGRLVELERNGLSRSSKLSRATMLHIGEDLDADFVVFGRFTANGTSLTIESRILKVNPARLLPVVWETGTLDSLMDLHSRLVWRMLSAKRSQLCLSIAEFTKRQRRLRLDAFEHYIRGLLAVEDDARLRELREAARLEPEWPEPDFAWAKPILRGATAIPHFHGTPECQRLTTTLLNRSSPPAFAGCSLVRPTRRKQCSLRYRRP